MSRASFTLNRPGVAELFQSPAGPVQRHLGVLAEQTKDVAESTAPRGKPPGPRAKPRTGPILAEAHKVVSFAGRWYVVAETPYAWFVHQGTGAHTIEPIDPNDLLAFEGSDGTDVFLRIPPHAPVNHPGTTANPWLLLALIAVVG